MKISEVATLTTLSEKTIRYYEDIGLVRPKRLANGYREFTKRDVHNLRFLARARGLGFSVEDCRQLLGLYSDDKRHSKDVKAIAETRLKEIEKKMQELEDMRQTLRLLIEHCQGDERPDCPILSDLAGASS